MARQRYCRRLARYRNTLRVSADPVAKPAAHTRAESRGSRRSIADAGERRTVCWREMDSNFRYRGRRPASGRSLRAQRVETDAAKREFGSGSCLFAPPWGGSGGLGGGLCPTPGNGQQESHLGTPHEPAHLVPQPRLERNRKTRSIGPRRQRLLPTGSKHETSFSSRASCGTRPPRRRLTALTQGYDRMATFPSPVLLSR
jgi:hypothetical protein